MRNILSLSLVVLAFIADAREVTPDEAFAVAQDFFNKSVSETSKTSRIVRVRALNSAESEGNAPYYVFNASEDNGFVIVSGDNRAKKIIGYSDKGNINSDNMPPQLAAMLEHYAGHIASLTGNTTHPSWTTESSGRGNEIVLETANWGQGAPYNLDCPESCVTGCVTTAMAIIMKYHGWPNRGRGSNSNPYDSARGQYSFDTEYDWDNALTDYSHYQETPGYYTDAQLNAVAKIMHDCATAIEAAFLPGAMTSADERDCAYALRNFFFYDSNIGHAYLQTINIQGDNALSFVKSEIDAGRPMIMAGYPQTGYAGHAWVVDGYNSEDMVHINWGWDGGGNGFYEYPLSLDYRASTVLYNVKPAENWVEYSPWEVPVSGSLNLDVVDVKQNEYFNAYCYEVNCSNILLMPTQEPVCTGTLAVALTDAEGNIKQILREIAIKEWYGDRLKGGEGFTGLRVTVPIADTDRIALIGKPTGYSNWVNFNNPPFVYTSRPVKGNTPKVANVKVEFIGDEFSYTTQSVGTEGAYRQTKPMASGSFIIYFDYPAGKDKIWIGSSSYPIGAIYERTHPSKPLSYISLPYMHGPMDITVQAMAYNESDLLQDWVHVNLPTAGTLESELDNNKRVRTKKLRITGVMNSEDFFFIRDQMPMVKHLDIAEVRIVSDLYNMNDDYIPDNALFRKRLDSIILPRNLKGIGKESLRENSFSKIELPATLEYIGLGAFWEGGDVDLMDVICNNPVPPTIQAGQSGNEEHMFESETYKRATLWVPEGSKDDYLSQPYVWHNFVKVKEFKPAGLENVYIDSDSHDIEIFNLQGVKVYVGAPRDTYDIPSGIYIYKQGSKCGKIFITVR